MRKVVPRSGSDSTEIFPSCTLMILAVTANPRPVPRVFLGAEERGEDVPFDLLVHAAPVVADLDHEEVPVLRQGGFQHHLGALAGSVVLPGAGVDGVDHDVGRGHVDQLRIAQHGGQSVGDLVAQRHAVVGGGLPVQLADPRHQVVEVDPLELRLPLPGVVQHVVGEVADPLDALLDHRPAFLDLLPVVLGHPVADQVGAALEGIEHVLDGVLDAGHRLADGGELLRLDQFPLELLLLGDVLADPDGADRVALAVAQARQRQQDVPDLPVFGQQAGLVVLDVAGLLQEGGNPRALSRGSAYRLSIRLPITSSRR